MKKFTLFFLSLLLTISVVAQIKVRGYYRKNGTYVQPHMRSSPDGNPYNNYSYPGNTNPYTGKVASGNPDTYLKNYYNSSSSNTSSSSTSFNSSSTYNSTNTPTYTSPTYSYPPSYAESRMLSKNEILPSKPTEQEKASTMRFNEHQSNVLFAKKIYLKDKKGNYTGEYLKLSDEDDDVKKYTLYAANDFTKGTLLVYSNGQRLLIDNFGRVIAKR